jgi:hypothetical protein
LATLRIADFGFWIEDSAYDRQSTIPIRNPQSAIRNPQSAISNPQSAIKNRNLHPPLPLLFQNKRWYTLDCASDR